MEAKSTFHHQLHTFNTATFCLSTLAYAIVSILCMLLCCCQAEIFRAYIYIQMEWFFFSGCFTEKYKASPEFRNSFPSYREVQSITIIDFLNINHTYAPTLVYASASHFAAQLIHIQVNTFPSRLGGVLLIRCYLA